MITRRHLLLAGIAGAALASVPAHARCPGAPILQQAYLPIGGIEQWVQIRGADRRNPVLLIVHGGPGSTWDPFTDLFRDWEQHFTMVYWDQRGAGKTYRKTGESIRETMTIERMRDDGIELADYLRQQLGTRPIIILGHSWGSVLGVMMAQKRPDLFAAYVGTGQVVSAVEAERVGRQMTLRRAEAAGRQDAVQALKDLGEPPYDDIQKMVAERKWAGTFDTPSDAAFDKSWRNPDWFSQTDSDERFNAWLFSNFIMYGQERQDGPFMAVDLARSAPSFRVPVIFIQGEDDHITPASLVADYEHQITAPRKALVLLPGGGHNAVFAMKDRFLAALRRQLHEITVRAA